MCSAGRFIITRSYTSSAFTYVFVYICIRGSARKGLHVTTAPVLDCCRLLDTDGTFICITGQKIEDLHKNYQIKATFLYCK